MKPKQSFSSTQAAVVAFALAAQAHAAATERGGYRVGNRNYDIVAAAAEYLRENAAVDRLRDLLHHEDVCVRVLAAAFLLRHHEDEARAALRDAMSNANPILSFDAEVILQEWEAGRLNI